MACGALRMAAGLAAIVMLAGGCTRVVSGTARPATGLAPTPINGAALRQVLLDDSELSKLTGQPVHSDPTMPPFFGSVERLPNAWSTATPLDCIGAAVGGQRIVYASTGALDAAHEYWDVGGDHDDASMTGVGEAVIALASASDAEALFEKFAEQWTHCNGVTVTRHSGRADEISGAVTDVAATDSVLTAVVRSTVEGHSDLRVARALGVRVNCIVDVEVFWFLGDSADSTLPPPGDTTASDIATAMLDEVRQLTG